MTPLLHPVRGLGERLKRSESQRQMCSREGAQNIQHNTIIHTHREGDIAGQTAMYIKRWRLN
jgi:hypothetical protein